MFNFILGKEGIKVLVAETSAIIINDYPWDAKVSKNMLFHKFDNYFGVIGW